MREGRKKRKRVGFFQEGISDSFKPARTSNKEDTRQIYLRRGRNWEKAG